MLAKSLVQGTLLRQFYDYGTRYSSKIYNIDFLIKNLEIPDWLNRK